MADLGIRRESKGRWERRAPFAPRHVEELVRVHGRSVVVQPSEIRVFDDDEYRRAGAEIQDDLSRCRVILGVKEVPPPAIVPIRAHVSFFHVIKGQTQNMPLLQRALDVGATLLDYEPIVGPDGRRLLFFGRHAGYAGMVDALWGLGRRLLAEGMETPFARVRQAKDYEDVEEALAHLARDVGQAIREQGLPETLGPLVIGVTGGGNVSAGAQEVLARLPVVEVAPEDLPGLFERVDGEREGFRRNLYKVVFRRDDRRDFARHLPYLTVLVNAVYWQPSQPRLVTWRDLEALWRRHEAAGGPPRLRLIADLSCDVEGSIEATVEQTDPDEPVFVADPSTRSVRYGVEGRGPVVLAVGNLPAEFPRDASGCFGDALLPFVAPLVEAGWEAPFGRLALPPELLRAVVCHRGELCPAYTHLAPFLTDLLEGVAP